MNHLTPYHTALPPCASSPSICSHSRRVPEPHHDLSHYGFAAPGGLPGHVVQLQSYVLPELPQPDRPLPALQEPALLVPLGDDGKAEDR